MDSYQCELIFKVAVIGDSQVGKSSLVNTYVDRRFDSCHIPTIGVEFRSKIFYLDDQPIRLQIWDTAGQERFRSIARMYFNNAHGIIICYDISDRASFDHVPDWLRDVEHLAAPNTPLILVGNKSDSAKRKVLYAEGKVFADHHQMMFLETSARNQINVGDVFTELSKRMCLNMQGTDMSQSVMSLELPAKKCDGKCC